MVNTYYMKDHYHSQVTYHLEQQRKHIKIKTQEEDNDEVVKNINQEDKFGLYIRNKRNRKHKYAISSSGIGKQVKVSHFCGSIE